MVAEKLYSYAWFRFGPYGIGKSVGSGLILDGQLTNLKLAKKTRQDFNLPFLKLVTE